MKALPLFISTMSLIILFSLDCPVGGGSNNLKHQHNDSLKNRNFVGKKALRLSIDSLLKRGSDETRFTSNNWVEVVGIVYDVKYGGSETCNCNSEDKSDLDIHIELIRDYQSTKKNQRVIAEINRFTRSADKSMTYDYVKSLKGKKVAVRGWLFFDAEHKHNAYNTRPDGTNIWRATCWEVHPCMSIKVVK